MSSVTLCMHITLAGEGNFRQLLFAHGTHSVREHFIKTGCLWGVWLAQSEEYVTLNLRVVGSSPVSGMELT